MNRNENEDTAKPIHKSLQISPSRTGLEKNPCDNTYRVISPIFPFKCDFDNLMTAFFQK